jgi:hypothetical protein
MNIIRTIAYIRTPRMLKGFRACVNTTGKSQIIADYGRIGLEEYLRLNRVQNAEFKRVSRKGVL